VSSGWIEADWPAAAGIIAGTTLRDSHFEFPAEPRWLKQVHGKVVVRWDSDVFRKGPPEADAIVSDKPGSICVVRTADCLPILLCSADGTEIAAVHAGWRGLAAGVVDAALDAMNSSSEQILAWIGPAISQDAFEVGHEVREAFGELGSIDAFFRPNDRGRLQADLPGMARHMLERRQVTTHESGLCTHGDPDRFVARAGDLEEDLVLSLELDLLVVESAG